MGPLGAPDARQALIQIAAWPEEAELFQDVTRNKGHRYERSNDATSSSWHYY